jgi:hypothetical protein
MQRLLLAGRGESWARSAVEHGYYDEAHMVNDERGLVDADCRLSDLWHVWNTLMLARQLGAPAPDLSISPQA